MTTGTSAWTVDQLARRVAEAEVAEWLRHHDPMDAWELARLVGEHADRVGRSDLGCDFRSPEVKAAAQAVADLKAELVAYCQRGPNPVVVKRARVETARRIAKAIAEIDPTVVASVENMRRLAIEAALAEGAPL